MKFYLLLSFVFFTSTLTFSQNIRENDFKRIKSRIITSNNKDILDSLSNELKICDNALDSISLTALQITALSTKYRYDEVIKKSDSLLSKDYKIIPYIYKSVYVNLTSAYISRNQYSKGVKVLLKLEEIINKDEGNSYLDKVYQLYAHLYYMQKKYDHVVEYLLKSEQLAIEAEDMRSLSATYNNIAVIYKIQHQYLNTIEYNKKSLGISKQINDTISIAKSHNNIGNTYRLLYLKNKEEQYYDSAIVNLKHSVELISRYPTENQTALNNICEMHIRLKKYDKTEEYLDQLVESAKNNKSWHFLEEVYDHRRLLFESQKKYKKAFLNEVEREKNRNILASLDAINQKDILITERDLLLSQKELELQEAKVKEQEASLQVLKLRRQQTRYLFIIIGVLLLSIVTFMWFYQKNKLLRSERQRVVLEHKVLTAQMNPHFIFNVLTAIQNSLLKQEPLKTASYLSKFARLIRMNFEYSQKIKISLSEELAVCKSYLDIQKIRFTEKFDYRIDIDETIDVYRHKIPPLLLQPLIENSIEHGFKGIDYKGIITICISQHNNILEITVKDNGKGFAVPEKQKSGHALDIFSQRLALLSSNSANSLSIQHDNGIIIKFQINGL